MSVKITDLAAEFQPKVTQLLANCAARDVIMVPFYTLRPPLEQGQLWRRSHNLGALQHALDEMRAEGAKWLADMLQDRCGSKPGGAVTGALPGNSWHQYGQAVDCYLMEDRRPNWNGEAPGYAVYAEEAEKLGLIAGLRFQMPDAVHAQTAAGNNPRDVYSWAQIDQMMRERFGP